MVCAVLSSSLNRMLFVKKEILRMTMRKMMKIKNMRMPHMLMIQRKRMTMSNVFKVKNVRMLQKLAMILKKNMSGHNFCLLIFFIKWFPLFASDLDYIITFLL